VKRGCRPKLAIPHKYTLALLPIGGVYVEAQGIIVSFARASFPTRTNLGLYWLSTANYLSSRNFNDIFIARTDVKIECFQGD
jgi:hypothetical protein